METQLEWHEHIRLRPGMYIGRSGDGTNSDDGVYILLKEALDKAIEEYLTGYGTNIELSIENGKVRVRNYGRGIPANEIRNFSETWKKNSRAIGVIVLNALSSDFAAQSFRDGQTLRIEYRKGIFQRETLPEPTAEPNGTLIEFTPDNTIFEEYSYRDEYVDKMLKDCASLHSGLSFVYNGKRFFSENGLVDFIRENMTSEPLYPIIHLKNKDIEVAITHSQHEGQFASFVNGQRTTDGTHHHAFWDALLRVMNEYFSKNFDRAAMRNGIAAVFNIKITEPIFESSNKLRLNSKEMSPNGILIKDFIAGFLKIQLSDYLYCNAKTAETLLNKLSESEKLKDYRNGNC